METDWDPVRGIAHDLRNLLTAMRGHTELALAQLEPGHPAHADLADVTVIMAAAADLVDELRADGRGLAAAADLDAIVDGLVPVLRSVLPPPVGLETRLASGGARVRLGRSKLERLLLNLAANSRDAMPDGGLLRVATSRSGGTATLEVTDEGPGFSEAAMAHLFEPGYTTRTDEGGSGLGLATCRRIVEEADGQLEVRPGPGSGARVVALLPIVEAGPA